jgi:hypothetical protein
MFNLWECILFFLFRFKNQVSWNIFDVV